MRNDFKFFFVLLLSLAVLSAMLVFQTASAQSIPRAALKYRANLTRIAHADWGLDAPVATFAAQLHQESGWNPQAVSRVGAQGMAQFMPATSIWWCSKNKLSIVQCEPTNPVWAMRSLVQYDQWLFQQILANGFCQRMAMTLSAYNGGPGWVLRDQKLAPRLGRDPLIWFGQVERANAGRSAYHFKENRDYPRLILGKLEVVYEAASWGVGSCTDAEVVTP